MSDPRSNSNTPAPSPADARRMLRGALRQTWRDLRTSIIARRPITLPNLLRLYQRRVAMIPSHHDTAPLRTAAQQRLADRYRRHQPFNAR